MSPSLSSARMRPGPTRRTLLWIPLVDRPLGALTPTDRAWSTWPSHDALAFVVLLEPPEPLDDFADAA